MTVLTGFEGGLFYGEDRNNPQRIAHCRNWSLTVTRDAVETTALGDSDRTYTMGLRGATGTATILYDDAITAATGLDLWNELFTTIDCNEDKSEKHISFQFDKCSTGQGRISFDGFITSFSHSVSVGEAQAATISFTASGAPLDSTPYPD